MTKPCTCTLEVCSQCNPITSADVYSDVWYTSKGACRLRKYTLLRVDSKRDGTKRFLLEGWRNGRAFRFSTMGPLERA